MCQLKSVLLPLFVFLSFTLQSAAQQSSGSIEGSVIEKESQSVLPGIHIGLNGTTLGAATDADGRFTISGIPAGTYTLKASGIGYMTVLQEVEVESGSTLNVNIELEEDVLGLDEVIVSATRSVETIDEVPASVTVLHQQEINEQTAISHNLNDILAQTVPGFSQTTKSSSNWGQNLRGREFLVLIDGIPQSTPLRAVSRDLQTIDAGAIERVEVIKGATAIYGNGATGGLVNYITSAPQADGFHSSTKVGSNTSLADASNSLGYRFSQTFMGKQDQLSYTLSGSYEQIGLYKDAGGDIIPTNPQGQGGLSEAGVYNLFGKVGYDLNESQQVELMYNFFSNEQSTDYVTVAGSFPGQKATAEKGEIQGESQGTRGNHNLRLNYTWLDAIEHTSISAVLYHQNYETLFGYYEGYRDGGQSALAAEKYGFRLNFESPFSFSEDIKGTVVYGADLLKDDTQQKLLDGRAITPQMKMNSAAPYAQLKAIFYDNWVFKGGLRFEAINIDVPDYTTVEQLNPSTGAYYGGDDVEGGSLNYNALTYNLGVSYKKFEIFNPYVSVSQGFSVADLGRTLRSATEPTTVQQIDPEPVIVQNYELGINTSKDWFRGNVAGFVSSSELGSSYGQNDEGALVILRSPEIIYGFEASAHLRPTNKIGFGSTFSFTEGRVDNNDNGSYTDDADEFLVNSRISPSKLTAYAQYHFTPQFDVKISMLHSLNRNRFEPGPDGNYIAYMNNIDAYTVFDLYSSYKLPFGAFTIGVSNLLNADYYPAISQWAGYAFPTGYAKGPGTRLNATLTVNI